MLKGRWNIEEEERFESLLKRTVILPSGCVIVKNVKNRPLIRTANKRVLVTRYLWEKLHGSIPDNLQLNHKCHNKLCINPEHLYLGTQAENMQDKKICGAGAKLSFEDVYAIKAMRAKGETYSRIGKIFNVSLGTIRKACINPEHPIVQTKKI